MNTNSSETAEGGLWQVHEDSAPAEQSQPSPVASVPTSDAPSPDDMHPILSAMHRLGLPLTIFGAIFCLLMVVVMVLLSPDRFPVTIGGDTVRIGTLLAQENALLTKESMLMKQHQQIQSVTPTPVLHQLTALTSVPSSIGPVLLAIEAARASFASANTPSPIRIESMTADTKGAVHISGRAVDSDGRSMQILASFVDALRSDRRISAVSEPEYQTLADGTTHYSPYALTITPAHHD